MDSQHAAQPLPDNEEKSYWSEHDVFADTALTVAAFLHRDYQIGLHAHEVVEINLVISGTGHHGFQDKTFATSRGDVFVIPPQVKHGYAQHEHLNVYHLLFTSQFFDQYGYALRLLPGFLSFFTVEPYFRAETDFRYGLRLNDERLAQAHQLLETIRQELITGESGGQLAAEALSLYLLTLLCRWYAEQHSAHKEPYHAQSQAIQAVLDLVAARYADHLALADFAEVAHMQRNYLCRIFREITGMSPMEYLARYRVHIARNLLLETDRSVTEIAQQVGFYDTAHFCRTFSRHFGISPSRLRK